MYEYFLTDFASKVKEELPGVEAIVHNLKHTKRKFVEAKRKVNPEDDSKNPLMESYLERVDLVP